MPQLWANDKCLTILNNVLTILNLTDWCVLKNNLSILGWPTTATYISFSSLSSIDCRIPNVCLFVSPSIYSPIINLDLLCLHFLWLWLYSYNVFYSLHSMSALLCVIIKLSTNLSTGFEVTTILAWRPALPPRRLLCGFEFNLFFALAFSSCIKFRTKVNIESCLVQRINFVKVFSTYVTYKIIKFKVPKLLIL